MSPKPFPRLVFCICLSTEAFPFVEIAMLKSPRRQPSPYGRSDILVLSTAQPSFQASVLQEVMEPSFK